MKNQRGATAVEFAIVLPLLVLLLIGIIEFSVILYDKAMITNASREGARAGIVSQLPRVDDSTIKGIVNKYCGLYLISFGSGAPPLTTIIEPTDRTGLTFGSELSVTVTYTYSFLALPKFVTGIVGPIDLTAKSVMRME